MNITLGRRSGGEVKMNSSEAFGEREEAEVLVLLLLVEVVVTEN